jgi:hypothetical protein
MLEPPVVVWPRRRDAVFMRPYQAFLLPKLASYLGQSILTLTRRASNMTPVNSQPIFADFGNSDEDGAVRLVTDGTLADLERLNISLAEGQIIWLTDNDMEMTGTVTFRNGIWVATPNQNGFRQVPLDAPYHINNLKEE